MSKSAIKKIRTDKGFTQTELAEKLGITQSSVAKWEIGLTTPTFEMIPDIAKALNCDINDLFNFKEE